MKKYISFLCIIMAIFCLCACGKQESEQSSDEGRPSSTIIETTVEPVDEKDNKMHIVTTIFPEYDWVKQIVGEESDHVDLTMLLDNGVDLHSYQPTAEDIMKVSDCDLFIYVGGESDAWVEDALKEATNKDMKVINLLDVLGNSVKEEEVVEGMQEEEENEESEEGDPEEEEAEYDEHVWLSLKNAQILCEAIEQAIAEIDSEHADIYKRNADAYRQQLQTLDEQYTDVAKNANQKTLIFGDRFPFRYLVDDYDLSYYAAFVGCSAETEASFDTITFLAGKVDELGVSTILTIEKSDQKIAQTIIENTKKKDQQILTMDSMQSTTSDDVTNGATYLNIMENNLRVLGEAVK